METITHHAGRLVRIVLTEGTAAAAALLLTFALGLTVMAAAMTDPAGSETDTGGFADAAASFYEESGSMSDLEILASARRMSSDTGVLYSELEAGEAAAAAEALSAFESSKAAYITDRMNGVQRDETDREWDLQTAYARMMVTEDAVVGEMIPRWCVHSCVEKDGVLELDVEEWVTMGYGSGGKSAPVNASAYSYSFVLCMRKDAAGIWMPSEINGTDINFIWLGEGYDPLVQAQETPGVLYEVQSDLDAQTVACAEIGPGGGTFAFRVGSTAGSGPAYAEAVRAQAAETADAAKDARLYAAASGTYTYKAAAAAAYADKYWKKYNRSYREYRGVDCANFVSQCLYAGGMPRTGDWYPGSVNWINVMGHIRHFKAYGTFMTAVDAAVSKGNPVYYDWNGNGTYDHTAICVGTNASGMPVVDAHTNNVYHAPWRMGSGGKRATIRLRSNGLSGTEVSGAKNTWQVVGTKVYYVGSDGKRVKGRFLTIGGKKYYFNASGVRVTGFFKVGTKWYYASVKTGNLLKGWQWIANKIYYFKSDFSRITGGRHRIGSATYYFNSKGVRQTSFIRIGSKWYYADKKTGKFITGWRKISGEWYYFDKKTMVKAVGWKTINGKRCYFDANGILKKGKHG